jgi:hypothetical protein
LREVAPRSRKKAAARMLFFPVGLGGPSLGTEGWGR